MQQPLQFETFLKPVGTREAYQFASLLNRTAQNVLFVFLIGFATVFVFTGLVIFLAVGMAGLPFALAFSAGPILIVTSIIRSQLKNAIRAIRLKRLAEANGFTFTATRPVDSYPGLVFSIGHSPQYTTIVNGSYRGLPFEFGNFYCTEGSGKNAKHRAFGVIEVRLTRRLPHILLDSRANNSLGFSNLPNFRNSQHLTLEGNFNDYFNLYVPDGYERDALYLITPELMVLLIDLGANFDIEIVDDRLYIYSSRSFSLENQQTIEQIFQLVGVLGAEVLENTSRYADANVGDRQANIVAQPGKRLKRKVAWLVIVLFVVFSITMFVIGAVFTTPAP